MNINVLVAKNLSAQEKTLFKKEVLPCAINKKTDGKQ